MRPYSFFPLFIVGISACRVDNSTERKTHALPDSAVSSRPPIEFVVEDSQILPPYKRSLVVRLQRKTNQDTLRLIASHLYTGRKFNRTFITYLLPGMVRGAGAWATTHYDPELRVIIFGSTEAQDSGMAQAAQALHTEGTNLGEWVDARPSTTNRMVLHRRGNRVVMHTFFLDNSQKVDMLTIRDRGGREIFVDEGSGFGEYYVITKSGDLAIYDSQGLITTATRQR